MWVDKQKNEIIKNISREISANFLLFRNHQIERKKTINLCWFSWGFNKYINKSLLASNL